MINLKTLGQGLAANLVETSPRNAELKILIDDAFRRGLNLGMTLRRFNKSDYAPQLPQLSEQDGPPCSHIH